MGLLKALCKLAITALSFLAAASTHAANHQGLWYAHPAESESG